MGRKREKKGALARQIRNSAERRFYERMRLAGVRLVAQPRAFPLNEICTYTPDFYSPELDIYYEVIGTRQAREFNWLKLELFRAKYPAVRLGLVKPDGTEWADRVHFRDTEAIGWGLEVINFFHRRGIHDARVMLGIMSAARKILAHDAKRDHLGEQRLERERKRELGLGSAAVAAGK